MAPPSSLRVEAPSLRSLVDDAAGQVPFLARYVAEALHDELRTSPQFLALQSTWRRLRGSFVHDFEAAAQPLLRVAREGRDPMQTVARPAPAANEPLRLVDEQQALLDVALARVVHAAETAAGSEILQLNNCFAALRGTARARSVDNPLRPAVFAQALLNQLAEAQLPDEVRQHLLHEAAKPMAEGLARLYARLCQQLLDAGLSHLLVQHGTGRTRPDIEHQRLFEARIEERRTSQMGLLQEQARLQSGEQPDLLSQLYRQILSDARLQPSIKALVARLEPTMARLATHEPTLLGDRLHPAWQLLNRLAANGMAFDQPNDPRLEAFVDHMRRELEPLIDTPVPRRSQFAHALHQLEQQVDHAARQRDQRSTAALAALEREEQREAWMTIVREQLVEQIGTAPLGGRVRAFLHRQWAEVIVQAMVLHGQESREAQASVELVDALLDSLRPLQTEPERLRLREKLPRLIEDLRRGAASIAMPAERLEPVLQQLMEQHGRVLRGRPALLETPLPQAQSPLAALREAETHPQMVDTEPGMHLRKLLDETPSQMPSRWAEAHVDRAALPTVPVTLYCTLDSPAARAAVHRWIEAQRVGLWYHLFVQGDWLTAQLSWISENRHYFHFVGQNAEARHSLTRGALERLLPAGLIAVLGADGIVDRAVDSLMQNLGDAPG